MSAIAERVVSRGRGVARSLTGLPAVVGALVVLGATASSVLAAPAGAAEFGFRGEGGLVVSATNRDGSPDAQAGSHPYALTTSIALNLETIRERVPFIGGGAETTEVQAPVGGAVRDIEVSLPPGLVGDPTATPQCELEQFRHVTGFLGIGGSNECPADSQIGMTTLNFSSVQGEKNKTFYLPVFNLVPPTGAPAEFGFLVLGVPVVLIPRVRTGGDDGVNVQFTSLPQGFSLLKGSVTLWGVPADPGHDSERGVCWNGTGENAQFGGSGFEKGIPAITGKQAEELCSFTSPARPFLTLPTSCTGQLRFTARIDSWLVPGAFKEAEATIPGMTGCDKLAFNPQIVAQSEPAQADSPSGLSVEIKVPQTYENPTGLAEANLRDTTVTLPAGVTVNPSAADGLAACSEEQFGLHTPAEVACPNASKLGVVEVTTPLLVHPLLGGVYLAQQGNLPGHGSNPFGSLLALYLTIRDPYSGVLVKLAGEVKPDPANGQLVTTFLENPQVPFDSLKLSFFGGPRAALVNPPRCGSYTTSTEMTPWSGGASSTPSWTFAITSGPGGSPCVASQPFAPSLVSGTESNQAGGFSPFSLTFYRSDGEQNMSRIQVKTPPGLLGTLAHVTLCPEPQAQQGTCGPESLVGHTTVAVGAGSNPFYVTGDVYLTGSYGGAPFGLSFVVPAVAGPLSLGVVVVRAAVNVDPATAALTVTSEPLPQIIQGIPLHIRAVNVTMDRDHFILNPTTCNPLSIGATMTSALGQTVRDDTHFQATNCAALAFAPKFTVTTAGHTSRAGGASLDARIVVPQGSAQANFARVKVELPKVLPSRLTTLQKACTAAVFEANPASCPPASLVGYAKASTPLLPVGLTGPAYFVSHGGEAFPSLIIVLEGYGVRVNLIGSTFISKKGVTSSTFASVPDVPVETFELYLPEGPYSALAANGNLCKKELKMPTEMLAQDGTVIHQDTRIGVTGCTKANVKPRKTRKARHARRARGARRGRDARDQTTRRSDGAHGNGRST